jgi:hypothetical protein
VPLTLLASLTFAALRLDALEAIARALSSNSECPDCDGHGDLPAPPSAHDPIGCVACPACDGAGELVTSGWDADRDAAAREVLSLTLVRRGGLPIARAAASKLRASLEATVARSLTRRGCPLCHELRSHAEFVPQGMCLSCHVGSSIVVEERRGTERATPRQRDAAQPFACAVAS